MAMMLAGLVCVRRSWTDPDGASVPLDCSDRQLRPGLPRIPRGVTTV